MDNSHSHGTGHDNSDARRDSSREDAYDNEENERRPRLNSGRVRSHSAERHIARFLGIPPAGHSRTASPTRDITPIMTRDYADYHTSSSPHRARARIAGGSIGPSSMRRRVGSVTSAHPSHGPAPSWAGFPESSRRSVAIAPTSYHDNDNESRKFSFAGQPTIDTVMANQPYVDPGYAQLNPAYDQPVNVRPVWGMAKPLPRVLRSGMVPAKDEVERELQDEQEDQEQTGTLLDLESGRIEPSLRLKKIASQLDLVRRERELSLFRAYRHLNSDTPDMSPFAHGRRTSDAYTETQDMRSRAGDTIVEEPEGSQQEEDRSVLEFPQLREAIAGVNQAREEEALKTPYQDAFPLPAYHAEDDEIHNLHTYWSVIRLRFREPFAEFLGMLVMDTLGISANLVMTVSKQSAGSGDTADWAWGLAAMMGIYIAGGISGAHFNSAMSLMLSFYRGFPIRKIPMYAVAQFLAAFCAALISYGLFQPGLMALQQESQAQYQQQQQLFLLSTQTPPQIPIIAPTPPFTTTALLNNFITGKRQPWVTTANAFLTEFVGTAVLAISVLALGDDTNAPPGAGMNAFIVGLLVVVLSISFAHQTGLALNPMRDFGPRVAMYVLGYGKEVPLFADGYWFKVAWLGPIAGALAGGFMYDTAIFVGGESPINYPSPRIRRAARKWKTKWRARMGRTRKRIRTIKNDVGVAINGSGYERVDG